MAVLPMPMLLLLLFLRASAAKNSDSNPYIVHMDVNKIRSLDPAPGPPNTLYHSLLRSVAADNRRLPAEPPELLYVYENAFTGFSAKLSDQNLQRLKTVDGFLSATEDELLTLHTTHSPRFLGLQKGRGLWEPENLASDVIIGVVDTGIWPEHPSFGASGAPPHDPSRWKGKCQRGANFTCNQKLVGARAFFKGYESIAGRINETLDYRSPRDSSGHGTHTASTAGGNFVSGANLFDLAKGSAAGMRPTARIAAYKACYRLGCASSDILAAVDRAVKDGVDVLSLSLGGTAKSFDADKLAIAAFGAVKRGIFVTFSAGNSGPTESTVTNIAPWMMTVAASYTDRTFPAEIRLGNGQSFVGASLYVGRPTRPLLLAYAEGGTAAARFCVGNSLSPELVRGKIVICDRGINGRVAKGEEVKKAGGAAMILANNDNQGDELFADPHVLPAAAIGATAARALKLYLNQTANATAGIKFDGTVYNNPAPVVAAFSSRGPSRIAPEIIKPDVTAPGVNILAAWPPNISPSEIPTDKRRGLFNIVSGTSMSCPHVSGLAALLRSRHKNWSPAAIKSALMTTAYTKDSKNSPIPDAAGPKSATPFSIGSGHVDPEKASDPGLVYDIDGSDYLLYLCSLSYNSSQIALFAGGNFACPKGSDLQPGDLNYPSFAVVFNASKPNSVKTYRRTVTNVGIPVSSYAVKVEEPEGVSIEVKPAVLKFRKLGEKLSYGVRFDARTGVVSSKFSFGSIVWVSEHHSVRSPVAVSWVNQ
ncbi:subtilisin-like protease SBT1.1 [Andrographis paniculata]|uniref:subtilisin-like protease SBT1.1 n=1 Tax=Andrographis paniculata TaxID=175694 RepID=UPI0021E7BE74|nr:subtilisin-like protease SBT1.1 [Andrographis paniculata]